MVITWESDSMIAHGNQNGAARDLLRLGSINLPAPDPSTDPEAARAVKWDQAKAISDAVKTQARGCITFTPARDGSMRLGWTSHEGTEP